MLPLDFTPPAPLGSVPCNEDLSPLVKLSVLSTRFIACGFTSAHSTAPAKP